MKHACERAHHSGFSGELAPKSRGEPAQNERVPGPVASALILPEKDAHHNALRARFRDAQHVAIKQFASESMSLGKATQAGSF